MDLGLLRRRVAIAGGSRGLGAACAAAFVAEGATVAIGGRDPDTLGATARRLGAGVHPIVGDLHAEGGGARFVRDAIAALGGLDILVLNGGGPPPGTVGAVSADAIRVAFEQLTLRSVEMVTAALPTLRAGSGRRSIIAITSIAAKQPTEMLALSSIARTGLTAYLRLLATEVASDGITVNAVAPGYHATERLAELGLDPAALTAGVPMRTIGDPDDLGRVVAFLAGEPARYLTGQTIVVDGGGLKSLF